MVTDALPLRALSAVQEIVKVVVCATAASISLPEMALLPDQPPLAEQAVPVLCQESVGVCPEPIRAASVESVTPTGGGADPPGDGASPPPPPPPPPQLDRKMMTG